jgi:hypothetical protein
LNVVVLHWSLFCFSAVIAKQLPHTAREKNGPGAKCWLDAVNWRNAGADSRQGRNFLLVDKGDRAFGPGAMTITAFVSNRLEKLPDPQGNYRICSGYSWPRRALKSVRKHSADSDGAFGSGAAPACCARQALWNGASPHQVVCTIPCARCATD